MGDYPADQQYSVDAYDGYARRDDSSGTDL